MGKFKERNLEYLEGNNLKAIKQSEQYLKWSNFVYIRIDLTLFIQARIKYILPQ